MELLQITTESATGIDWVWQLLSRFIFNAFFVWVIIHIFYYRKTKNINFYFTFSLISISVFFLIFLLGSGGIKIKMGMALGLFAIFGILRYRTEVISVREMTYLFVIISLSVINALALNLSYAELLTANVIYVLAAWILESYRGLKHVSSKLVLYDRIELVVPEKMEELKADLHKRTGLKILRVEVGSINFLQDTAMLKVYYEAKIDEASSVDQVMKLPKNF